MSPEGHRLIGVSNTEYLGEFKFRVSVVAKDGRLPYIVRFTPQQLADVPEELSVESWTALALFGGGVVPHGDKIPPHAALRAEFSERLRTPPPVTGGPEIFTETFAETSFGTQRVLRQEVVGVDFRAALEPQAWTDSVEGDRAGPVTVLTSETVEGLEISTDYLIEFPGAPALTSNQSTVRDRSGEPLTFRFANDPVARDIPITDRRGFTTAPVRIDSPLHRGYLNVNAFLGGDVSLSVGGQVADFVEPAGPIAEVVLTLRAAGSTAPLGQAAVAPDAVDEINLTGVAVDRFSGPLTFSAVHPDGAFEIVTEAFTADASVLGMDVIRVTKDTIVPTLIAGFEHTIAANDPEVTDLCVTVSADTVLAELFVPGDISPISGTAAFQDVLLASPFGVFRKFCFAPFDVPGNFTAGRNELVVRLTDAAGNVSSASTFLLMRPVLISVSPDLIGFRPGDHRTVVLVGYGLDQFLLDSSNAVVIDGRDAPTVNLSVSGVVPATMVFTIPFGAAVSSGPISIRIEGVSSEPISFEVCHEEAVKLITELDFVGQAPFVNEPWERVRFGFERGVLGEPVSAWVELGRISVVQVFGDEFVRTDRAASVFPGDLIQLVRRIDGTVVPVWVSIASRVLEAPDFGTSLVLPSDERPRTLKVAFDPTSGEAVALVVSSKDSPSGMRMVVALYTLTAAPTRTVIAEVEAGEAPAFSVGLALGLNGRGWILAGGSFTHTWHRLGANWIEGNSIPGFVTDAAASADGSQFHAVVYRALPEPPHLLGRETVNGSITYWRVNEDSATWSAAWFEAKKLRPEAFRPPPDARPEEEAVRIFRRSLDLMGAAASIRIAADGQPRIAFIDLDRRTLRLMRALPSGSQSADVIVLDDDVTLGHFPAIVLDGNGEALVGYLDYSHAAAFVDDPDDDNDEPRLRAALQVVDTRNRNDVRKTAAFLESRCSPTDFETLTVSNAQWQDIRRDQGQRMPFNFLDLGVEYNGQRSGELFLTDGFIGAAAGPPVPDPSVSRPALLVVHDRPEWIFLHEDGLTLSVRRTPLTLPVP